MRAVKNGIRFIQRGRNVSIVEAIIVLLIGTFVNYTAFALYTSYRAKKEGLTLDEYLEQRTLTPKEMYSIIKNWILPTKGKKSDLGKNS